MSVAKSRQALSQPSANAFTRHRGPITGVALIPGTSAVLSSGYDGAVGWFDLESGSVALLGYHRHLVNRVVVDRRGRRAASCSSDYTVGLWDVDRREPIRSLMGHYDDVEDFVFVDDSTGVSASRDRRLLIWDLASGSIRNVLEGHDRDVLAIAYHAGRIYSSGDDMTLRVWDLGTGRLLETWGPFDNETDTCALDPGRNRAVLGCDDGHLRIFDTRNGELVADLEGHRSGIKKVAVSPHTGDILSAAYDQRIVVWDAETLRDKLQVASTPGTWERSLTWSPDGRRILAGTFDGTVRAFDAERGQLQIELGDRSREPGNGCINGVACGPAGMTVVVADDGLLRAGRITIGDARSAGETRRVGEAGWHAVVAPPGERVLMNAVTLSADGARIAAGTHDNRLLLYDNRGDQPELAHAVAINRGPINSIRFCRHGAHRGEAFVGCYGGVIVRVGPEGDIRGQIEVHDGAVKSLRLHPTRPVGVSCGADGLLLSWSLEGELLERYIGHDAIINDVDLDPSGRLLASVSRDFTLKVYQLDSGKLIHNVAVGRRSLKSVCFFGPERVFVGDYWGHVVSVALGAARSGQPSASIEHARLVARNGISDLARSGDHLVAVSYSGSVALLDPADLGELAAMSTMTQRLDDPWDGWGIRAVPTFNTTGNTTATANRP